MATVAGTVVKDIDRSEFNSKRDPVSRSNTEIHNTAGAGVVARYVQHVELLQATQMTLIIADASYHSGIMTFRQTGSGTNAHTVTLAIGSFDGTNNTATFNAIGEYLAIDFDSMGNGIIVENVDGVGLSAV